MEDHFSCMYPSKENLDNIHTTLDKARNRGFLTELEYKVVQTLISKKNNLFKLAVTTLDTFIPPQYGEITDNMYAQFGTSKDEISKLYQPA